MKKPGQIKYRFLAALFLTLIYLVIVVGPLAPALLGTPHLAHAMTGECAGDCGVCGCSPEKRANHTCCCQQKLQQNAAQESSLRDCCKKKEQRTITVARCACPCGSGKAVALLNPQHSESLPSVFDTGLDRKISSAEHLRHFRCMPTRPGDPPDPPPKLSIFS
jgi:hypothetical protein